MADVDVNENHHPKPWKVVAVDQILDTGTQEMVVVVDAADRRVEEANVSQAAEWWINFGFAIDKLPPPSVGYPILFPSELLGVDALIEPAALGSVE